jgi:signal transduction histidine kinase
MTIRGRFRLPGRPAADGPQRRLFRKYLIVLVGLVGSALLVTSLVTLYFTYRDAEAAAADRLEQTARQHARALAYAGVLMTEEVAATAPRAPDDGPPTLAARRAAYERHIGRFGFDELAFVDRSGREVLRVARPTLPTVPAGRDRAGEPAVRTALANAEWGPREVFGPVVIPEPAGDQGAPRLTIAVSEAGDPGGATVAQLSIERLVGIDFYFPGGDVTLYLVDSRGRGLAHPPTKAMADAGLVRAAPDLGGLPQIAEAVAGAAPGPAPLIGEEPAITARPATWERDVDGKRVLSASAPVPALGWRVLAEERRGDVLAPVSSAAVRTGIFLAVFLALAVVASALLARRMVRPITVIESGARRIGEGDLDERIELDTGDELESLGDAFNQMAGQLRELYGDLERRVDDRTRDLTAALEQNAALLRQLEEKGRALEAVSRHKSEFLATMSHELRTPLNAIIGFSEVLRERMFGELNERQAQYLEDIHVSGRHLLALIDDVLDLSKVEAGRIELELDQLDVRDCLDMGLMMVGEGARRRGIRLESEVDPAVGPIRADERRLRQVVFNLLANAVRFTPDGGTARHRPPRGGRAADRRERHGSGDRLRRAGADLRDVPPGRRRARRGGHRPRPPTLTGARRAARRPPLGREPPRRGEHVRAGPPDGPRRGDRMSVDG